MRVELDADFKSGRCRLPLLCSVARSPRREVKGGKRRIVVWMTWVGTNSALSFERNVTGKFHALFAGKVDVQVGWGGGHNGNCGQTQWPAR
jgi:hypothetical protein